MKKHFIHTIISAMVFWGVYGPAAALSAEDNQSFLGMINEIRTAPYYYAIEHLECTPDSLIANGILPETSFAPYILDPNLTPTAANESKLMAGEEIPESPLPPFYRLTASTGGVVSFFNFMPRKTAFRIVINYFFKKELDNKTFDHILSKEYSAAGIAISAGKVGSGNAWFVAICLRSSELVSEIQMLNLINQVRSNPEVNIWKYTDCNHVDAYKENPNIIFLLKSDNKYKPLFFDASLSASARDHSFYVLNGKYPDYLSETNMPLERAAYHDYEGEFVQEFALRKISSSIEENDRSVYSLFLSWIEKELKEAVSPPSSFIFLKGFQDVGSNITFQSDDNISNYDVSALSFVVGKNDPDTNNEENSSSNDDDYDQISRIRIYGILFSNNGGNGLYVPGEELIQQTVTVSVYVDDVDEMQEIKTVRTDNAGHFSMTLNANRQYRFVATIGDVQVSWDNDNMPITSDQFVTLYPPTVLPLNPN